MPAPLHIMRHAFILLSSLLLGSSLQAQYTGLNPAEISYLREKIGPAEKDSNAANRSIITPMLRLADQSLNEQPHPIDTIRTEGLLQGNPRKIATAAALTDMPRIYALALVYRLKGQRQYLDKAAAYLHAWAAVNISRGDPIDDTNLDNAIEAYDMLKTDLGRNDDGIIRAWLRQTARIEISSPYNSPRRATATNNWNSHRLKIIGEIAFAIGDTALQAYAINGIKTQITGNLNPDGSSTDFISRDALHYHVYDLEPLLRLAIVLQRATGVDYYSWQSPTGSSIEKSVEWLQPYLDGRQTHPEFVNSTVQFDRDRAKNNEPGYKAGTLFDPASGAQTLLLASWFEMDQLLLAKTLYQKNNTTPPLPILFKLVSKLNSTKQ